MQNEFKLRAYYHIVQLTSLIAIFIVWFATSYFSKYFLFLGDQNKVHALMTIMLIAHFILYIMLALFKHKIFFTITRAIWGVFFASLFIFSGGISSPFIYLMMFPLLVACTDLNARDVRTAGIIVILFLLSFYFFQGGAVSTSMLFLHAFNVFNFSIISYFVYELAKEKDAIHRNFDRLSSVDHLKSDFVTVASNRLRSPLTAIYWAFSELKEGMSDESRKAELINQGYERAQSAVAVLNELIQTIELDVFHFKSIPKKVDIGGIVREIICDMDYFIKKKEVTINLKNQDPIPVPADPKMIKLAIENIISNAVSYSPKGKVDINIEENGNTCRILVKDNGIGISSEDIPLVFDRLYRGKEAMLLEPNRSGIGMYAAKHIIELHGGSIAIFSEKGKGTTVTVILPM